MEKTLQEIRERVLKEMAEAKASSKLEQIRVGVLGKKGELTGLLRGMGKLPAEERPKMGQMVNETRAAIEQALAEAAEKGVKGKATTPFLLAKVKELTGGDSLNSNIRLVYNNAALAAKTAKALKEMY